MSALVYHLPSSFTIGNNSSNSNSSNSSISNDTMSLSGNNSSNKVGRSSQLTVNAATAVVTSSVQARDVSNALFGLQKLHSSHPEVRALVLKLLPMVNAYTSNMSLLPSNIPNSTNPNPNTTSTTTNNNNTTGDSLMLRPTAQEIDNALFGLKSMSSSTFEIQLLIRALIPYISLAEGVRLSPNNISAMYHALQNLNIKHDVVRGLVHTLNGVLESQVRHQQAQKTQHRYGTDVQGQIMSGMGVGNALYGLRNMSSNYREVRRTVQLLLGYIRVGSAGADSSLDTGGSGSLLGLRSGLGLGQNTDSGIGMPDSGSWNYIHNYYFPEAHNISNALYGLRRMSSSHSETRAMLDRLADVIESDMAVRRRRNEPLMMSPQEVSNIIYGFQSLNSEHFEGNIALFSNRMM